MNQKVGMGATAARNAWIELLKCRVYELLNGDNQQLDKHSAQQYLKEDRSPA
ncbi:MAG: hypothetical protein AAF927_25435 [Bacteroidota bacterium]